MRRKLAVLLSAAMVLSCTMGSFGTDRQKKVQAADAAAGELQVSDLLDMGELSGWAAVAGEGLEGTTGGNSGQVVVVDNTKDFVNQVKDDIPKVVVVKGKVVSMLTEQNMDVEEAERKGTIGDKQKDTKYQRT